MNRRATLLLLALLATGCATTDSPQAGNGGTKFEVRGKRYDDIWRAAVKVTSQQLSIVEHNTQTGTLRAEKGVRWSSWGEVVGVFVQPARAGAPVYTVEVQSMKRSRAQITGQDWTMTIVSGIKSELGI